MSNRKGPAGNYRAGPSVPRQTSGNLKNAAKSSGLVFTFGTWQNHARSSSMEKVVRKFESFAVADQADREFWRHRSGEERLHALLELILPENPDEAVIERSARVYPLARPGGG
jgi:hypothetical protein